MVFWITIIVMGILSYFFYESPKDFWIMGANFCSTFSIVFLGDRYIKLALSIAYQQLSQKASPNAGGDEWLCSLFLRTHFLC